jgi:hypothetical protein
MAITQSRLKELLHYDQETGIFTWIAVTSTRIFVGDVAGSLDKSDGYVRISIDRKSYKAHRLAWLYVHDEFPPNEIDHINRVTSDNRICNLRSATRSENMHNTSIGINNTSGHVGVSWHKQSKKWMAHIRVNCKKIHLGRFDDINEATAARIAAKQKYHAFDKVASK